MHTTSSLKKRKYGLNLIAEKFILDSIRYEHPEWIDQDGDCLKCREYYESLNHIIKIKA